MWINALSGVREPVQARGILLDASQGEIWFVDFTAEANRDTMYTVSKRVYYVLSNDCLVLQGAEP